MGLPYPSSQPEGRNPMYTIHTNVPITRRKSYFLITSKEGETVFRDRHFWPCIAFLDAMEEVEYILLPGEVATRSGTLKLTARKAD
jgi:hypothetical protein